MMSSRALLLRLRRLHYEHAPDIYKNRFLPAPLLPSIVVEPKPSSDFLELWGENEIDAGAVTIARIKRAVCRYYKVTNTDLISARRTRDITLPRQVAMYLCRHLTVRSMPEIGRQFGGRDHTTVHHADIKIKNLLLWKREVIEAVATIRQRIG
jgi:hypothetical protein